MSDVLSQPYRRLQALIVQESLEPTLGWGLRMAIATTVPLIWGISTGHQDIAQWITLAANNICWVALKGTYAQRFRLLAGGVFLTFCFGIFGSATSGNLW